jgi:hypothetical protein
MVERLTVLDRIPLGQHVVGDTLVDPGGRAHQIDLVDAASVGDHPDSNARSLQQGESERQQAAHRAGREEDVEGDHAVGSLTAR